MEKAVAGLNIEDADMLNRLILILDNFRTINPNVTANQILVFLHVAMQGGVSQRKLEQLTGLDDGTISRICAVLSDRGLKGRSQKALGLINIALDEDDYRYRKQTLTNAGKRMLNSIRHHMRGL